METKSGKRFALLLVLTIIGMALFVPIFLHIDINTEEILTYLFGVEILDYRILDIEGTAHGIFFGWFSVFAMLMLMAYFMLCIKISGILYKLYPCKILSTSVKVNIDRLSPDLKNQDYFYSATDEQLVIKNRAVKGEKYVWLALVLLFIFLGYGESKGDGDYKGMPFLFWGWATYACMYWVYLLSYTHTIIFDRMTGLVSIPNVFWLPSKKVKMENIYQGNDVVMKKYMAIVNPYTSIPFTIPGLANNDWWSFYVWYMDRNRPLPHGTIFDAYRERDFKRREAQGFPKPLYETGCGVKISDKRYDS